MSRSPVRVARCAAFVGTFAALASVAATTQAAFTTFSVGGDATPASIQPTVDAFRAALGNPNNGNIPGPLVDGRREINWDGGGATTAAVSGNTHSPLSKTPAAQPSPRPAPASCKRR